MKHKIITVEEEFTEIPQSPTKKRNEVLWKIKRKMNRCLMSGTLAKSLIRSESSSSSSKNIIPSMKDRSICSNCGKPTGGRVVLSPSLNPKRRNQCKQCADICLHSKEDVNKLQDWEKFEEIMERCLNDYWSNLTSLEKSRYISNLLSQSQSLSSQLEEIEEWANDYQVRTFFRETGMTPWGNIYSLLDKLEEMKKRI